MEGEPQHSADGRRQRALAAGRRLGRGRSISERAREDLAGAGGRGLGRAIRTAEGLTSARTTRSCVRRLSGAQSCLRPPTSAAIVLEIRMALPPCPS